VIGAGMKELNQFTSWADSVSNSYLTEADFGKKKSSRALTTGIQSIAQREYPDLDPQEALITYMGQKLTDMETKDAEQIKLINRQSQETNKLMNTVQGIRAAYDDLERSSQQVEQELDQIRGGAERAKSGQEQNIVSAKEIMKIESELEELRKKPGMTAERFKELEEKLNNSKGDKELFDQMANNIKDLLQKNEITRSSYNELMKEYDILEKDRNDREKRFADSLTGNASKFKEYESKIKNLETEIANTLKKFPDEKQIEKLKDVPKKVRDVEDRIEKNDKLDENIFQN
jgi:chromosome segregation ATPase